MNSKRNIAVWMTAVLLITSVPSAFVLAASETDPEIYSYSTGPRYSFSYERSAEDQLYDIFTTIDLQDATISEMQDEMAAGHLTSEMLTKMYLDRIEAYDKKEDLNSVIRVNENALEDAKALDKERAAGKVRGKLHGIPIIVKDNYNVAGMPTSAGAVALANLIAKEDSGTVKKLREAGAVIIGKANMSEFAFSAVNSHSTLGGDAHNAYDTKRSPAGSSGGTATAVRSNFAAAGLGTDTGGSIRNPSSWSGLFGIRPTKGLTSIGGVLPLSASRDTTGPMAKTAEDLSIVLEAMAGCDDEDDYTLEAKADDLLGEGYSGKLSADSLKGKRIAFLTSSFDHYSVSPDEVRRVYEQCTGEELPADTVIRSQPDTLLTTGVNALARRARSDLIKAGAEFVDLSGEISDEEIYTYSAFNGIPSMEYDVNSFLDKYAEGSGIRTVKDILETGEDIGYLWDYLGYNLMYSDPVDSFNRDDYKNYYYELYEGKYIRSTDWEIVLRLREKISAILKDNGVDAIMYLYFTSPAVNQNAEYIDYNDSRYSRAFGPALGFPDMSIPMGFVSVDPENSDEKLPMGMGLIGDFGGEKELFEIAYGYEKQAGDMIRKTPENTPPLRDERLNSFLDALMEEACALDPDRFGGAGSSLFRKLNDAYDKALKADYSDPYSVYDAAYELAVSYDRIIDEYELKKSLAGTVLIKGQKIKGISSLMFEGVEGINAYSSDDKKTASVTGKGVLKGKRPGRTVIRALDKKNKKNKVTLSSCTVTVLDKPKLVFKDRYTVDDAGKELNAGSFLVSPDYDLLEPDKWESSKPEVAVIDKETGIITIKGKGKTKITARFGNVKVRGVLKVVKTPRDIVPG